MAVAVKGLLKGLRFISHMFEDDEHEMQISGPTDVRHVAHIGWDGPTVSPPSWMDNFKGDGETTARTPAQDTTQVGTESVDESPSRRHRKASKHVDVSEKQSRKKKVKGSSKKSAKSKSSIGQEEETSPNPDLEGG